MVPVSDGLALVLFVTQAWPRRLRRKADQKYQCALATFRAFEENSCVEERRGFCSRCQSLAQQSLNVEEVVAQQRYSLEISGVMLRISSDIFLAKSRRHRLRPDVEHVTSDTRPVASPRDGVLVFIPLRPPLDAPGSDGTHSCSLDRVRQHGRCLLTVRGWDTSFASPVTADYQGRLAH